MAPRDPLTPPKLEQRLARPALLRKSTAIGDSTSTRNNANDSAGDDSANEIKLAGRKRRTVAALLLLVPLAMVCYVTTSNGRTNPDEEYETSDTAGTRANGGGLGTGSTNTGSGALRQSRRARRDLVLDDHLADLTEPLLPNDGGKRTDLPVFWHIAKSGGTTIKDLYATCYGLTLASEIGGNFLGADALESETQLRLIEARGTFDTNRLGRHVNVDVTTPEGIKRAASLRLAQSGMADVLVTPLLHDVSSDILSRSHRGRMFALFRHPIDRLVSLFYYLQTATHEPTYNPILANMTLSQYAASGLVESNWMVRSLSNKMEGPLSADDLEEAKRTLRTKCLVGLLDEMETSLARFRHFFGFDRPDVGNYGPVAERCQEHILGQGGSNRRDHPVLVDRNSREYDNLARKNVLDLILYEYARELFVEQGTLLSQLESAVIPSVEMKRHLGIIKW